MHLMPSTALLGTLSGHGVGIVTMNVIESFSIGNVELVSADSTQSPHVRFNRLSDPRSSERLVSALRFLLELLREPMVAAMHRELFFCRSDIVANLLRRNRWNGLKAFAIASILDFEPLRRILLAGSRIDPYTLNNENDAVREFVCHHANPQMHYCGNCRMGRADDSDAVANGAGQVYGVIMAPEKIADAVKAAWGSN